MKLESKVGIVTGAAQGIGQAAAEAMAVAGASVVVSDINLPGAQKVAEGINKAGGRAIAIKTDISSAQQVKAMIDQTIAELGHLDIMVNNAGYNQLSFSTFVETDEAEWRRHIDVTLIGTLHCCQAVIPPMLEGSGGRIINISSDAAKMGVPTAPLYSAVKAGIAGFSRSIAADLARTGITVNCVSPGPIRTPTMEESLKHLNAGEEIWASLTPMGKIGMPEDVAAMIVFLASDEAAFITGQDYSVDGGARM